MHRGWSTDIRSQTSSNVKQRVKDKTGEAMDLGVFGSPYFLIEGEPFFGSDRMWQIERFLGKGKTA